MFFLFRMIRSWLGFSDSTQRRQALREDLKFTHTVQQARGSTDYFLQRDLAATEREQDRKPTRK